MTFFAWCVLTLVIGLAVFVLFGFSVLAEWWLAGSVLTEEWKP